MDHEQYSKSMPSFPSFPSPALFRFGVVSDINGGSIESQLHECPGFCGRVAATQHLPTSSSTSDIGLESNSSSSVTSGQGAWSECGACPHGERNDGPRSQCRPCAQPLGAYEHCFLLLYVMLPFFANLLFIKLYSQWKRKRRRKGEQSSSQRNRRCREKTWLLLQMLASLVEFLLTAIISLLLADPKGAFTIVGCAGKRGIHEWYPFLNNPVIDYTTTLKCSYELVYPLYSLPFLIVAVNLAALLLVRGSLHALAAWRRKGEDEVPAMHPQPLYATLWLLPLLALFHALLAGPLYYAFPYMCIVGSLVLNALHLSMERSRSVKEMLQMVLHRRLLYHLPLLLVHMGLLGFGLLSAVASTFHSGQASGGRLQNSSPSVSSHYDYIYHWAFYPLLLTILPLPTLFYILTTRLTAPLRLARYRPR